MDEDLDKLGREELLSEVKRLRAGIRAHRDSTGQELCWHHPELWGLLPEKIAPDVAVPTLPAHFVAVKFYTAASLPPTDSVRRALQSIVLGLAERTEVVMLDTGLALDDHEDYSFGLASRIHSVRESLRPRDNLAVQTAIISRASSFVGTCGALAWLAPMLGVDTTAVLADARFLHGHLQVARRVYQVIEGGRFSPLDISAFEQLGLPMKFTN